jgi:hypothetical protein
MGYLYVRRSLLDRIRPVFPGWKAARKRSRASTDLAWMLSRMPPGSTCQLVVRPRLPDRGGTWRFQTVGINAILERDANCHGTPHALNAHGLLSRRVPDAHRSTIVSVPVANAEAAMTRLRAAGVVDPLRAGRVRLAVHRLQSR